MRGLRIPYKTQGLIYFTCHNINRQDYETKRNIRNLIDDICGDEECKKKALYAVIASDISIRRASIEFNYSVSNIYRWRMLFFEKAEECGIIPPNN